MDSWKVGWAREGGHIAQVTAPGHRRRRCCYVDILNTGPAVAATLRRRIARVDAIRRVSGLVVTDPVLVDGRLAGAAGFDIEAGRAVTVAARATVVATGGPHRALRALQRVGQHGGRGACFRARRRRRADRHGVRAVLPPSATSSPASSAWTRSCGTPSATSWAGGLLNGAMEEFLPRYGGTDAGRYTATRDLATHAIWREARAGRGSPHGGAWLSFTHVGEAALRDAFGPVIDRLEANGIDLTQAPVEVAPIAHYHMGGIAVDAGLATCVPGLYAAGEAVGGANGANRFRATPSPRRWCSVTRPGVMPQPTPRARPDAWAPRAARPALDTLASGRRRGARGHRRSPSRAICAVSCGAGRTPARRRGAGWRGGSDPPHAYRSFAGLAVPACGVYDTGLADWYTPPRRAGGGRSHRCHRRAPAREPGRPPARGFSRERRRAGPEPGRDPRGRRPRPAFRAAA